MSRMWMLPLQKLSPAQCLLMAALDLFTRQKQSKCIWCSGDTDKAAKGRVW